MPPSSPADAPSLVKKPPVGLAVVLLVGPSLVWAAEYIGSGEVILATRTGAVLGTSVLWAIVAGILLKFWIGMSGARYTVITGEGMIDLIGRMPGPKNWAVWIVLVGQLVAAAISIGSLASAAGAFVSELLPLPSFASGWLVTVLALAVVWSGVFDVLKIVMSLLVAVTVVGVLYVAAHVFPGMSAFLVGLIPQTPEVPPWAVEQGLSPNPWREILPLLGWGAGGFASQVWYTYWVMGAGYGMAARTAYGQPANPTLLQRLTKQDAEHLKGWCRVVYTDASLAMILGILVTTGFMVAGAGVLGPRQLAPDGPDVAFTLSTIFSSRWGEVGGFLFILGGAAALIATQIGQLAGWPRLLADSFRLCIPGFARRFPWKTQFRLFLLLFLFTNMVIVYTLGVRPVFLVQLGAILDGLLLTPLQALWVGLGLYLVLPKLLSKDAYDVLRPHWSFAVGLALAFLVFGYFCIVQIPFVLFG